MKKIETEVLVIGGGATGTGVARDLAMRGFNTVLVEKGDLTHGTTGRYHGLLHSGARYVVKDPQAALECIQENVILRKIMPQCIEDTGGFFVLTEWDDPDYAEKFFSACQTTGIPVEEISVSQMLKEEPLLNPKIRRCFRVPDASADSFFGAELNAESARQHGAEILNYHQVMHLIPEAKRPDHQMSSSPSPQRVAGALCHDLVRDEQVAILADLTINAAGAWVGQIAQTIGFNIPIIGGKGTMLAVNHRIVNTVINRCKMPSDGDILVPVHTVAVIGTTDVPVQDPDRYSIEPWEVRLCLEEGEKLIPGFKYMRMLRAWAGVRPLYKETESTGTRDITRAFVLLDHAERDGVEALVSITSGKWTTYRKMAEATVDLACRKLNVQRPCKTHEEVLPSREGHIAYYQLGHRLREIEREKAYGKIICECELATRQDIEQSILQGKARSLDDIRRKVRLGMGPCQGGFCTYRAIGILHEIATQNIPPVSHERPWMPDPNLALRDFLQERWKGLLPVLWGQQLRQERFNQFIYLYLLNADQLPGPRRSLISPTNYALAEGGQAQSAPEYSLESIKSSGDIPISHATPVDVLVVGAGLAGLVAAWQLARRDRQVRVVAKGWGSNHWGTGCIDILGKHPTNQDHFVKNPGEALLRLTRTEPLHPYSLAGLEAIENAIQDFLSLCLDAGYPFKGSLGSNWLLPTALGVPRQTCLAPETMTAGDLRNNDPMLILGLEGYHDFYPTLIADNLATQGFQAKGVLISLPSLKKRNFINPTILAELFDSQAIIEELCLAAKSHLKGAKRVGVPAVLGLRHARVNQQQMEAMLGLPVFEIPALPPSIPGIRLHNLLADTIHSLHSSIHNGAAASGAIYSSNRVKAITTLAAQRNLLHAAEAFVLATGGILGGGITTSYTGYAHDTVLGLSLQISPEQTSWHNLEFIHPEGHPVHRAGFDVDRSFRLLSHRGNTRLENVYAIGSALGHYDGIPERSLEGVALVSGHFIGSRI